MDEAFGYLLLALLLLAIPTVIIVLLIVFMAKTVRLSREVDSLKADIAALTRQIGRLIKAPDERQRGTRPQETIPPGGLASPANRPARASDGTADIPQTGAAAAEGPFAADKAGAASDTITSQPARVIGAYGEASSAADSAPAPADAARLPATAQPAGQATRRLARTGADWESMIGGRLLNWIGAIALVFGVAFSLIYAFENKWIPPIAQVATIASIGFLLIWAGDVAFRRGMRFFAQGVNGAGISVVYLACYWCFSFYHLVDQVAAFAMMSAITILTFALALRYDSLAVSILGWAGGFLTPILLSTGHANETGLFTYVALLVAGLLAVVARKLRWAVLEPLTLASTYAMYAAWYGEYYSPQDLTRTAVFLTIFWLLFHCLDLYQLRRPVKDSYVLLRQVVPAFSVASYYAALYAVMSPLPRERMAAVTLVIGIVYLGSIGLARLRSPSGEAISRLALTALVLLVVATALEFSGFTTVFAWSIEALLLTVIATRLRHRGILTGAMALFALALIKLFGTPGWDRYDPATAFSLLLNQRALAFAGMALGTGLAAVALRRARRAGPGPVPELEQANAGQNGRAGSEPAGQQRAAVGRGAEVALQYAWPLLALGLLTLETLDEKRHLAALGGSADGLRFLSFTALAVIWIAGSLGLLAIAEKSAITALLHVSIGAGAVAGVALIVGASRYEPITTFAPIVNARVAASLFVMACLILESRLVAAGPLCRPRAGWLKVALEGAFCSVLFALCTEETLDAFRRLGEGGSLDFRKYLALCVVWTAYTILLLLAWLKTWAPALLCSSLISIGLALFLVVMTGYEYDPIEMFEPIANLRFLATATVIAGLILSATLARKGEPDSGWSKDLYSFLRVVIAGALLFLLTVETKDYFGKTIHAFDQLAAGGAGYAAWGIQRFKSLQQMALSIAWLVYSILLIAFGFWRRALALRIAAIVIFGITILKIFIYDLGFLATVYRIFSFVALGLILLSVSYLYQRYKAVIFESGRD